MEDDFRFAGHWTTVTSHGRCFAGFGLTTFGAFLAALYHILAAIPATLGVRTFVRMLDDTGGICKAMAEVEEWRTSRCTVNIGSRRMLKQITANLPD